MNEIKYLFLAFILGVTLTSCDKESVRINAQIANCTCKECKITVDPIGKTAPKQLGTYQLTDGVFDARIKGVKPPVKLTFHFTDTLCKVWVGEYGKNEIEGDFEKDIKLRITNTFFNKELSRFNEANDEAYLSKIRDEEKELKKLQELENQESIDEAQKDRLYQLEDKVKKAYRLKKKALLSAVRKDPKNAIAMTVFFDMYSELTSWQKEECLKNAQRYFSDCGINWQLRN
jgi:hypothetical protein